MFVVGITSDLIVAMLVTPFKFIVKGSFPINDFKPIEYSAEVLNCCFIWNQFTRLNHRSKSSCLCRLRLLDVSRVKIVTAHLPIVFRRKQILNLTSALARHHADMKSDFTKNCVKPWVFVKGEPSSGKSYYLAAVLNGLAADGEIVCFINGAKRFDELKSLAIKNRKEFDKVMAELESCGTMVFDDFGNEFKSEYIRDQIILPILSERSRAGLRTYFTSQYGLDEIKQLYSLHKSYIEGSRVTKLIEKNIEKVVTLEVGIETVSQKRAK